MAAPNVPGKYVSTTTGMNINDYIKCVYEAPINGKCGYFSQLGTKEPYLLTITNKTVDGVKVIENEIDTPLYGELSTGVPSTTPSGYFYLIKLDQGFLVADRMVQWGVTWAEMNTKNYIYGAVFNCEDARTTKYVDIEVTTKDWEEGDPAATPGTNTLVADENFFNDTKKRSMKFEQTAIEITTKEVEEEYQETTTNPETGQETTETKTRTVTVNDKTITTKTTTLWVYAKVPDNIAKIANTTPVTVSVALGADISEIKAALADITEVTCTIVNNDDSTYEKQVAVTKWNADEDYDKGKVGNQIITGDLEDLEAGLEPIRNPSEIKASCIVIVSPDQITEISTTFEDITVPSGTTAAELLEQLNTTYPSCTIKYKKHGQDDSEAQEKEGVAIIWDAGEYTGEVGETTIFGALEDLTGYGINNDGLFAPAVKVITEPAG